MCVTVTRLALTLTQRIARSALYLMSVVTILKRPRDESVQTQRKYFRKTAKGKVVKGKLPSLESKTSASYTLGAQYFVNDISGMISTVGLLDLVIAPIPHCPPEAISLTQPTQTDTLSCQTQTCSCTRCGHAFEP